MAKYQITLDEKQLETLLKSTEAFSRICTGQLKYALEQGWALKIFKLPTNQRDMLDAKCRIISMLLSGGKYDGFNASAGIYSDEIDEHAVTAYNIHQVLRHQKWEELPESLKKFYTRDASVSICNGEEPIKIKKID